MIGKEIEKMLSDKKDEILDLVWSAALGYIKEIVEIEARRVVSSKHRLRGRPKGRRNFGAPDYWAAVEAAAKEAPVSASCWPNTKQWREAIYHCGSNNLLVEAFTPTYSPDGQYFTHVNAPWRYDRQPFDALDLRIAKALVDADSDGATAAQFTVSAAGKDIREPHNKISVIAERLKSLESYGLAVFDPENTTGHAGSYRPRWYKATDKLADILLMM
jgi:hypothetical protein